MAGLSSAVINSRLSLVSPVDSSGTTVRDRFVTLAKTRGFNAWTFHRWLKDDPNANHDPDIENRISLNIVNSWMNEKRISSADPELFGYALKRLERFSSRDAIQYWASRELSPRLYKTLAEAFNEKDLELIYRGAGKASLDRKIGGASRRERIAAFFAQADTKPTAFFNSIDYETDPPPQGFRAQTMINWNNQGYKTASRSELAYFWRQARESMSIDNDAEAEIHMPRDGKPVSAESFLNTTSVSETQITPAYSTVSSGRNTASYTGSLASMMAYAPLRSPEPAAPSARLSSGFSVATVEARHKPDAPQQENPDDFLPPSVDADDEEYAFLIPR